MRKLLKNITFYLYAGDYSLIYFLFFVFSALVLGYGGIWAGYKSANEKSALLQEMLALEASLENKEAQMFEAASNLKAAKEDLELLNLLLPSQPETEDFLTEITAAASEAGHRLDKFRVTEVTENYVKVSIEFHGEAQYLPQLLERLNKLNRISVLDKFDTKVNDRYTSTTLYIYVYYLK